MAPPSFQAFHAPFQRATNHCPDHRVAIASLITTLFTPSKLCGTPGLFPFVPSGSFCPSCSVCGEASGRLVLLRAASRGAALAARTLTMEVGAESELEARDIFRLLSKSARTAAGAVVRACVDKMAPRPSSAPAIMAAGLREGD